MLALKKHPKTYATLVIAVVIGAFFVASWLSSQPKQSSIDSDVVGICVHSLSTDEAQLVNESGAGWIRIDASENLTDFGAAVKNATASGLKVLGILDSWMFNKSTVFTLQEWSVSITYYVSQYADYVDAWEIWNEPANPNENCTLLNLKLPSEENMTKIVDFYYSMAQTAYPIIRQYDPTAKILLLGGLHLWSGGGNDTSLELDRNFSRQLAVKNIEQYGDYISVHAYPWNGKVEPQVWDSYTDSLGYYRGLFQNKSVEVWVTETGKPIEEDGENGQAQYLVDAFGYFDVKVTRVFWYSLLDNGAGEKRFGLIGNEMTPRRAYYELQNQLR